MWVTHNHVLAETEIWSRHMTRHGRHQTKKESRHKNVPYRDRNGWTPLDHAWLSRPHWLAGSTYEILLCSVLLNAKRRFEVCVTFHDQSQLASLEAMKISCRIWYRVCQGHSDGEVEHFQDRLDLAYLRSSEGTAVRELLLREPPNEGYVVHFTQMKNVRGIDNYGLRASPRNAVHFALLSPDTVEGTVAGSHISKPIMCVLDIEAALREGHKLYISSNDVVLSETNIPRDLIDIIEVGQGRFRRGPREPLSPPWSMPVRYDDLVIAINNKFMRRMPAPRLPEEREATQLEHRPVLPSNWEEELEEQGDDDRTDCVPYWVASNYVQSNAGACQHDASDRSGILQKDGHSHRIRALFEVLTERNVQFLSRLFYGFVGHPERPHLKHE